MNFFYFVNKKIALIVCPIVLLSCNIGSWVISVVVVDSDFPLGYSNNNLQFTSSLIEVQI